MKALPALLITALVYAGAASGAETPCDFKGVSVGDKMSPSQLMTAFGVTQYKINPKRRSFDERLSSAKKYGIIPSGEAENWKIGPYCDDNSCVIPGRIGIGNSNTPTSVHVAFRNGQIIEIDVSFGQVNWDEIVPILKGKYGTQWKEERDPAMVITDIETKKSVMVERITLTHRRGGVNGKTRDTCEIWASNYDIVHYHHDPLGAFHSVFVIRLVSKNF